MVDAEDLGPLADRFHGGGDLVHRARLLEIPVRSEPDALEHCRGVVSARHDEHPGRGELLAQPDQYVESTESGEPEVEHHHVRAEERAFLERLDSVSGLSDDL